MFGPSRPRGSRTYRPRTRSRPAPGWGHCFPAFPLKITLDPRGARQRQAQCVLVRGAGHQRTALGSSAIRKPIGSATPSRWFWSDSAQPSFLAANWKKRRRKLSINPRTSEQAEHLTRSAFISHQSIAADSPDSCQDCGGSLFSPRCDNHVPCASHCIEID